MDSAEVFIKIYLTSVKKQQKFNLKIRNEFAKGFGLEGASEATTLATEKVLDALLLEDETAFDNAFYELMDTFLIGGFVGGPLKAGPVGIQKSDYRGNMLTYKKY